MRRVLRQRVALAGAVGAVVVIVILLSPLISPVGPAPSTCLAHQVCGSSPMHIHSRLYFFADSNPVAVPANIGVGGAAAGAYVDHSLDDFLDLREGQKGQLAPVHTHDGSGYIHVEASVTRAFTLGEFFDVWGQPLGPTNTWNFVADPSHHITLKVNDVANTDWRELVLVDNQKVEIRYTTV